MIDNIKINELKFLKKRLKNSVDTMEIQNWLENFNENERYLAKTILQHFTYVTIYELTEFLNSSLEKILKKEKNRDLIILSIEGEGKSGQMLLYYLAKTLTYKNNRNIIKLTSSISQVQEYIHNNNHCSIVFLDDIIGSGGTFERFYKKFEAQNKLNFVNEYILAYYINKDGKEYISQKYGNIIFEGEEVIPIFRGSLFGARDKMVDYREFSYKYGVNLYSIFDHNLNARISYPLGYKNSQTLIAFAYNCPNTTLPIIWSDANSWYPLFPRYTDIKMERAKKLRKEMAHLLCQYLVIKLTNYSTIDFTELITGVNRKFRRRYVQKNDFLIFSIIRLLKQKRPIPIILQLLGISQKDFDELIKKGIERNLLINQNELSIEGEIIYSDFLRKTARLRYELKKEILTSFSNTKYLPTQFNGRS